MRRTRTTASIAAFLAAFSSAASFALPTAGFAWQAAKREHSGRVYGHGSRKYSGPRDVDHRRSRRALTRETLRGWRRSAFTLHLVRSLSPERRRKSRLWKTHVAKGGN